VAETEKETDRTRHKSRQKQSQTNDFEDMIDQTKVFKIRKQNAIFKCCGGN
jgi:hypothetical protein